MSASRTPVSADTTLGNDSGSDRSWRVVRPPSGRLPLPDLRDAWRSRELALILALRELRLRYKQTLLGVSWAVLQPLLGTVVFTLLLGKLGGLPADGLPYFVFVFVALVAWWYVSSAVTGAAESLLDDRDLVTKARFPRLLAPLAALLSGLVDLGIAMLVAGVLIAGYGVTPDAALLLLPVWILALVVIAAGVGLWLSALAVQYRDIRHALPFAMQLWFFASPIVFASSLVSDGWRYLFAVNPLAGALDGLRWSLLGGPTPGAPLAVSGAVALLVLASGLLYFERHERRFADVI